MENKKIKRKIKLKKPVFTFIYFLSIIGLLISTFNIGKYILEHNKTKKQEEDIIKTVKIKEIEKEEVETIEQTKQIDNDNPYWDFIKMNLIDVDIKKLKEKNNDVKGWIQVKGTNINYPFVQTKDNDYYLNHSFNKTQNSAGWIFLDYRNDISNLNNRNTIIYGHGRLDNTMFGTLKNILNNDWINNSNNYVIKISTEYENTLWQVFSVYKTPYTNDYLRVNFSNNEDFLSFTNKLIKKSQYDFRTPINETDRILTLSTCVNTNDRAVLHAKLIKREIK